jgi:oligopeptide/dipeptide ABC transporter ATP-binding protein
VRDLKTYFFTYEGVVRALDGINLKVRSGETTGIVGETGCGKSVTAFSINRLVSDPGRVVGGEIRFRGADLLWGLEREAKFRRIKGSDRIKIIRSFRRIRAGNERLAAVRGRHIAMIFQEPMQAMNPVFSISDQLGEPLLIHRGVEIIDLLLAADDKLRGKLDLRAAERRSVRHEEQATHVILEEQSARAPPKPSDTPEAETGPGPVTPIDELLGAVGEPTEKLRAATTRFSEAFGLPSLGTQMFYALKTVEPGGDYRPRVLRGLRRVELSRFARSYLRYRRRLIALQQQLSGILLNEMTIGKMQRARRGSIRTQMALAKLRSCYFSLPGLARAGKRAIDQELYWRTVGMLEGVRIANPARIAKSYPHELSGGMLQRVMIAMALSCTPDLLLADEPTTALDVTIQMQVLDLMRSLKDTVGTAIVLITHDLGVIAEVADRVNVMYAGRIVESGSASELYRRPLHPYTQGLLSSIPRFDQPDKELQSIPGSVPNLIHPPPGCRFHPRCPYAMKVCKELRPAETPVGEEHMVACHLYETHEDAAMQEPVETPVAPGPVEGEPATPA